MRAKACILAISAAILGLATVATAKLETWRHDTATAFAKGKRERVVVSDSGTVRLGRALTATAKLDATRVWDLARSAKGVVYAATGDAGQVFRREGDGAWDLAFDGADTQALALAALPDGRVFVGTGPSGQVIELTAPNHPVSRPDPAVQYIWDLAADAKGNLYAATGPAGQLWKRSADGAWSLVFKGKHSHLLSVAVAADGVVYAGSDGEGLIYKVATDGKVSIVYDAPQAEIRTLLITPDGALYAGTAAESGSGGGGGPGRGSLVFSTGLGGAPGGRGGVESKAAAATPGIPKIDDRAGGRLSAGGTATPRPPSPGDNAVYRVGTDGVAREVFRAKVMIYALAWQEDRLLVGTGPEGILYEVRGIGRESTPLARLDNGQILALLAEPTGGLLLGVGDPGGVLTLGSGHVTQGSLTSDILDARLPSRFGALSWRASTPSGTTVAVQVRTGNVGEPDATWSDWSPEQTDPAQAKAMAPSGRFAQYRLTLKSSDAAQTPEVRSVSLRYQTTNLPPEIGKLDVPDLSAGDGTTRQTKLNLKWDATDPNGDDLNYTLHIQKDGWPDWVKLGTEPLTDSSYTWDTTAVPAGSYRLKLTASDRLSNPADEALSRDKISEPFYVDHQAPSVSVARDPSGAKITASDELTRITKAAYALDGGEWVAIFPDDGLFDTSRESITLALPDLKPGAHVLTVRATDAAGNVGTGDIVFTVR